MLEPSSHYRLGPGDSRAYPPDLIHSTAHPGSALVIRVTGTDLDRIPRYGFDPTARQRSLPPPPRDVRLSLTTARLNWA